MKNNTELSARLRQLRKSAGLSQEQLAEALDISRQAVSKWESGVSNPDIQNIIQLGKLYGISTDAILLGESPASENTDTVPENACTVQGNTDTAPRTAVTALLWTVLGTIIVLVLYLVTNMW
ncbi:MAG: helix-turn-helix transcriptional regulator [Lachnospiraceae bacterium]|nr:helix-turn-helix transcriptional regulator [Lachnospiraceae bacterium]